MKRFLSLAILVLLLPLAVAATPGKIVKEKLVSGAKNRAYYLYVPKKLDATKPAPLHGSGRDGKSLVDKWQDLADKHGFVLAGPDAIDSRGWNIPADGPDFLYDVVEAVKQKQAINPRRTYLFGHSAGAVMALNLSMFESQFFAATAIHAGAWRNPNDFNLIETAKRKTPIAIFVGTNDAFFPLKDVRATRDALEAKGFRISLTEIDKHTHWYYDIAPKINQQAWDFLQQHELSEAPHYERYNFAP